MKVTQTYNLHSRTNRESDVNIEPWLSNPNWKNNSIFSSNHQFVYKMVFFALFWNVFSYGMAYIVLGDGGKAVSLLILLFPAMGLWLFHFAFKGLKEWHTFGQTPLEMTPFPGVIGGDVGGRIPFRKRLDNRYNYLVTLTLIREHTRGVGEDKETSSNLIWQKEGVAKLRQVLSTNIKSELLFHFEVPKKLAESGKTDLAEHYRWQVTLENKEIGLNRSFEIPVYAVSSQMTASKTKYASVFDIIRTSNERKLKLDKKADIKDFLPFKVDVDNHLSGLDPQTIIQYPMFRKLFTNLLLIVLGSLLFAIGIFGGNEGSSFILIFYLLGGFIFLAALYGLSSSLMIILNKDGLQTEYKIFGFPIKKKQAKFSAIKEFKSKVTYRSRLGDKYIFHYKIFALVNNGQKIKLAEAESETARQTILDYFNELIV